ncbi:hypothetical protein EVAR_85787_1 [Eumeta japonica]|uniref:Uncharacterized protein n=1 Tax=Eumeta variegata TaxID=151549 RepID=A0A4C1UQ69_EUMVA|nr:hypothetical protein EVAR_85787_1 [Eumeta japonica]
MQYHNLTECKRKETVSAVVFHPANQSSGGELPLRHSATFLHQLSPRKPAPRIASLHERTLLCVVGGFLAVWRRSMMDSVFFQISLFSRASQCDGWLATVSDAPLPLHFIGGASVAHHYTSGHGTAVASADTARRSSKWDAAERHQSSRRPHELVVRTRHDVALGRRAAYRVAARGRGTESVSTPQPPLPEVIGEALTRAPVCRPGARCRQSGLRQRRRSARSGSG